MTRDLIETAIPRDRSDGEARLAALLDRHRSGGGRMALFVLCIFAIAAAFIWGIGAR